MQDCGPNLDWLPNCRCALDSLRAGEPGRGQSPDPTARRVLRRWVQQLPQLSSALHLRVVSRCAIVSPLHQTVMRRRGWSNAVGTGQDGLESRGEGIGCVATTLIVCLEGCLQSRVRDRCVPGVRSVPALSVCVAGRAVPHTGNAMPCDAPRCHATRMSLPDVPGPFVLVTVGAVCSKWVVSELSANLVRWGARGLQHARGVRLLRLEDGT